MSNNKLKIGVSLVIATLIVFVIALWPAKGLGGNVAPQNCGGSVTCFTDVAASNIYSTIKLWLGGSTDASSVQEIVSTGTCSAASTTLFAVANPFSATSTVLVKQIVGTGTATTSSLLVGTSTKSTGLASTDVSPTLVNATAGLATSSQFYFASGVTVGTGFTGLGSSVSAEVGVGPSEFVVGFSTSTSVSAAGFVPGQNCTYKLLWFR